MLTGETAEPASELIAGLYRAHAVGLVRTTVLLVGDQASAEDVGAMSGSSATITLAPPGSTPGSIPDTVGMQHSEAVALLAQDGFRVDVTAASAPGPAGVVVSQAPAPGSHLKPGATRALFVIMAGPSPTAAPPG